MRERNILDLFKHFVGSESKVMRRVQREGEVKETAHSISISSSLSAALVLLRFLALYGRVSGRSNLRSNPCVLAQRGWKRRREGEAEKEEECDATQGDGEGGGRG